MKIFRIFFVLTTLIMIASSARVMAFQDRAAVLKQLNETYESLRLTDSDSTMSYLDSMYRHFVDTRYEKGKAEVLVRIGETYLQKAQFPAAFDAYDEALVTFRKLNDELGIARSYSGKGTVEGRRGDMTMANEYLLTALTIYEKENNERGLSSIYLKLGVVNINLRNFDEAIDLYNKALTYALRTDTNDVITLYNNLGAAYFHMDAMDQAIPYFEKALDFGQGPTYEASQLLALTNLGSVYSNKGDSSLAAAYFERGIQLAKKHQLREEELMIRHNMTSLYEQDDLSRAIREIEDVWRVADSLKLYYVALGSANKLIKFHKAQGNEQEVIRWMEEHRRISEIRYDDAKTREISNLQAVYELNKSRADIVELQEKMELRQKAGLYFWLIFVALLIGLTVALIMNHRNKQINRVLKIREEELEEKDRIKDYLFSIIGHDLKGALATQTMALQMLDERAERAPKEETRELIKAMNSNMTEVSFVLDTLLHWGKKQIKGIYLDQRSFSIYPIVLGMIEQLEMNMSLKELTVTDLISPDTQIYADQDHFRFVLRNLMSNAVKYSNSGGNITIGQLEQTEPSEVVLYVRDEGVGINQEDQARIFSPFHKSRAGTKQELGNGLALMISKEFMMLNGGEIWYEDNEGPGSTFFFKWLTKGQSIGSAGDD